MAAHAQSATLAWDANTESDVSGYRIFYGTQPHVYPNTIDVGNATKYTVTGLDVSLDYYFAVQAYNAEGLSSSLSSEVQLPASVRPGTTRITSLTVNASYPLLFGKPVTWTASAVSTSGPVEYRFLLYSPKGAGWTQLQDYSSKQSVTWTPTLSDLGPHVIQLWARTVGSPATYEAWVNSDDFTVNANPVQVAADVDFPTPPGNPVHWTASIAGAENATLEYRYVLLDQGTGAWSELRAYETDNTFTWTPTKVGKYALQVWARKVGSQAPYEVWGGSGPITIASTALSVSSLQVDTTLPTTTGTTMTWTARARGGTKGPIEYQFVRYTAATGWQIVQRYSTSSKYQWTPNWGEQGKYVLEVWARSAGSLATYDAWKGTDFFDVKLAPIQITMDRVLPAPPGTSVKFTAQVADPSQSFEYQFVMYDRGTGTWTIPRPYSTDNTFTWTPPATGTFLFQVWARRIGSTVDYEVWRGTDYLTVALGPAKVISLTADTALPASVGTAITWTAVANGGTASPLQYRFVLYTEGIGWTELRGWGGSNVLTWIPTNTDVGRHVVQVWVRSAGSTAVYEGWMGTPLFDIQF